MFIKIIFILLSLLLLIRTLKINSRYEITEFKKLYYGYIILAIFLAVL
ncbi:MAG: hypothetical protein ACRC0S_08060 [Fusobacteriaceae bacterium]